MNITREQVEIAIQDDVWTLGNSILYQLCQTYPAHAQVDIVVAKVWLIGRTYAAAVERRKKRDGDISGNSDLFYVEQVAPALINSDLDRCIIELRCYTDIENQNLGAILELHKCVVSILKTVTHDDKRSLASKYLHFHLPNLFYIYDSRANAALSKLMRRHRTKRNVEGKFDETYKSFFLKLLDLREKIESSYGVLLSPRQLDRLLLSKN